MLTPLKKLLNQITMYRLMLYFLLGLWFWTIILSLTGLLSYSPVDILLAGIYLTTICYATNYLLAKVFGAKTNLESAAITALILTLIVGPLPFWQNLLVLTFIAVVAMASKYLLAINKKHIFNPAAVAVLLGAIFVGTGASWWVGSLYTLPLILLGGFVVLVKIKRFQLVASFLAVYFLALILLGGNLSLNSLLAPTLWFFAVVMLVEPLTSPSTRNKQVVFGGFVGLVYASLPKIIPGFAYGLEASLLAGNILNSLITTSFNLVLTFKEKQQLAENTWQFAFEPMSDFNFTPGQFLEWTYPHKNPDSRGVRRYFTISSAPEEEQVAITMRVSENGSSFKAALLKMKPGEEIMASSPQGDFILPKDQELPLVFMAGGIGVTPFRSMIKHLLINEQKRDIVMFYSNSSEAKVAFRDLFDQAKSVGVKTIYINTKIDGYMDENKIKENVPNYKERLFYVSGPRGMVDSCKRFLARIGINKIKTDFFPGYTNNEEN